MLYREFATQAEIDAEYNVGAIHPDVDRATAEIAQLSQRTLAEHSDADHDVAYGPTRAERLHVLRAAGQAPRPVFVFLHGGYWRAYAARDFALAARGPLARGLDVVLVDYALAPAVTLDEIVRQTRAAIVWVHRHAAEWGGDPTRVVVGGHSAGGHLTAMALATDWPGDYGLPADVIAGGVPLSGIFDLRPLPYSYLAPALQLSRRTIETQSPLLSPLGPPGAAPGPPRIVAVGGGETAEFRRQTTAYADRCRAAGIDARTLSLGDADHFAAVVALADPDSALTDAVVALAAGSIDVPLRA